jgi:hypothetical protein
MDPPTLLPKLPKRPASCVFVGVGASTRSLIHWRICQSGRTSRAHAVRGGVERQWPRSVYNSGPPGRIHGGPTMLIDAGKWQAELGENSSYRLSEEISRTYHFSGVRGVPGYATLRIVCVLDWFAEHPGDSVSRILRFRFYLRPFEQEEDMELVMRLSNVDQSKGGVCDVLSTAVEGETDMVVIEKFRDRDYAVRCLDAIKSGGKLIFTIEDGVGTVIDLQLPNNGSFNQLYNEARDRLAAFENGLRLRENIRKNPRSYAVWMYEPTPGEFTVLLVKLDSKGINMAESWTLGTYQSRTEQGSNALEFARDFQIELMDVVPNQ